MEGVGSRMGRASSRYGPSATAAVFNGPVRKWKRKWVHVSPSPTVNSHRINNSHSLSNGHIDSTATNNNSSRLLLCRWTPLSSSSNPAAASATDASSEEPRKRKIRYTPIVVLEEQRKAERTVEYEAKKSETNQFMKWNSSDNNADEDEDEDEDAEDEDDSERNSDNTLKKESQDPHTSHLALGLSLKGHNGIHNSVVQRAEGDVKKASSGGFSTIG